MKFKTILSIESRLYQCPVPLIGLTGGIATGKSQAGAILKKLGKSVIEADYLIKCIYQQSETLELTQKLFPEAISDEKINFSTLRQLFFRDKKNSNILQSYLYQQIPEAFEKERQKLNSPSYIIYDVPLLFEKKLENAFDTVVLIYAPRESQKARLKERDGTSDDMIDTILAAQMDIEEKKKLSPWVIENTQGLDHLETQLKNWLGSIESV
jgi:dephospho-CoA kinase